MESAQSDHVKALLEQQPELELQALAPLSVGNFRAYAGLGERLASVLSASQAPVDGMIFATILKNLELLREGLASFPAPAEKFNRLLDEWHQYSSENSTASCLSELFMSPAYQQIIGMGEQALPFILKELRREPDHWFWALRAITGENPVKPEHRGILPKMTEDWLDWVDGRDSTSRPS